MTNKMPDGDPALNDRQRGAVEDARALAAIPTGDDEALAVFTGHDDLTTVYPYALGHAKARIRDLVAIIDGLTGGAK